MQQAYYFQTLYPLQDRVLNMLDSAGGSYYLSGGTALSRVYLHHRFSDDLDFFFNRTPQFRKEVQESILHIKQQNLEVNTTILEADFARIYVLMDNASLKVEWINDVPYTFGPKGKSSLFSRTDNWQNILSNKLSALPRNEAKDLADILFICKAYSFSWQDVVEQAKEKDIWVDEIELSRLLFETPIQQLEQVNWIKKPDLRALQTLKQKVAVDILEGKENVPIL